MATALIKDPLRTRILSRCRYFCWYCGNQLIKYATDPCHQPTIDHLHPLSLGGTHNEDNLVAACKRCNSRKRNRTLEEYREYCSPALNTARLLENAIELYDTPYDDAIIRAIEWLRAEPPLLFFGEKVSPNEIKLHTAPPE